MRWESFHRYDGPEHWDAIVVGSGIGGLMAAYLLGRYGDKRVLVLERHYEAGGFTHTFRRHGYEWDVGVHYIGDVGRPDSGLRRMFDALTGGRLEWAPMPDVYDRIFLGDRSHDLVRGERAFRDGLAEAFPGQATAIDEYLGLLDRARRASRGYFAEKVVPAPVAWLAGGLMRRSFLKLARRTTRDVLEELTDDRELIAVLTGQFGDYGLPPARSSFGIHAVVAGHYLNGGFYPVGGAGRIAEGAATRIREQGGRVLVSAEVAAVIVENGRAVGVRMADGTCFRAPIVVSNVGAALTYGGLVSEETPGIAEMRSRIRRLGSSVAHLGLYTGFRRTDAELGLDGTNLWIYPDERHDDNVTRFLADPDAPLPLVYISFPSAKDPSFQERFPGRCTVDVITLASYDWFARWQDMPWKKRGEEYEALKERFADRLLEVLYAHRPQLRGRLDVCELSTPLSTRTFTSYESGEIYGLAHTPARFEERALRPRTPVPGLWLSGQDVATCGVAGAMAGGAMAASAILGRPVIDRVVKDGA